MSESEFSGLKDEQDSYLLSVVGGGVEGLPAPLSGVDIGAVVDGDPLVISSSNKKW